MEEEIEGARGRRKKEGKVRSNEVSTRGGGAEERDRGEKARSEVMRIRRGEEGQKKGRIRRRERVKSEEGRGKT